jgi:hypothetical protein
MTLEEIRMMDAMAPDSRTGEGDARVPKSYTLLEQIGKGECPRTSLRSGQPEEITDDEVEQEGDDFEFRSHDGRDLDTLAEDLVGLDESLHIPAVSEAERRETLGQGADGGGMRFNAGKNRIDLLPPEWIWALADVMTQGAKKYDERNWEKGMDWSAMIGCIQRHLAKFQTGQRYDGKEFNKELGTTGCHELAMVAWNALALMYYDIRNVGNNDMPISNQLDLFNDVNAATSNLEPRWVDDRISPPKPGDVL